ncbi:TraM recognition domain-containing protein [Streptomyces sp. BP-8]|uniref:Type IV secretory system conjugative DNA transfer family protein n=1 Tax=Streptomyces sirii TaxID=3127701 RepID=A0ABZ2QHS5_9ACTN
MENRFLPFNFLAQPYDDHAMAEHVAEAARGAWPELAHGAPTFENILKHSVVDSGTSLIVNLAVASPDARRLFGCLLTVGMETAALSRANVRAAGSGRAPHFLILDEFSQFMAQSEESLTRMLSETRKYNLFCVMAHQNWSQASDRLKGALQNVGMEVVLKAGRPDAEHSARLFGVVDPDAIKHVVSNEAAEGRTHPAYYPLAEQWERQVQSIQQLRVGEAFVRLPNDQVRKVNTPTLPGLTEPPEALSSPAGF